MSVAILGEGGMAEYFFLFFFSFFLVSFFFIYLFIFCLTPIILRTRVLYFYLLSSSGQLSTGQ